MKLCQKKTFGPSIFLSAKKYSRAKDIFCQQKNSFWGNKENSARKKHLGNKIIFIKKKHIVGAKGNFCQKKKSIFEGQRKILSTKKLKASHSLLKFLLMCDLHTLTSDSFQLINRDILLRYIKIITLAFTNIKFRCANNRAATISKHF